MHVLFIGSLMWHAGEGKGMPSVHKCVKGYETVGHRVTAIFPTNDKTLPRTLDYDGMKLHLVQIPLLPYTSTFSHLRSIWATSYRWPALHSLFSALFYVIYSLKAFCLALRICLTERVDLVCGLTIAGAPTASLVGRLLRKPVIFRLFGTETVPFEQSFMKCLYDGSAKPYAPTVFSRIN